jgi:phage gp16-like protein
MTSPRRLRGYACRIGRVTQEWLNHAGSYAVTRLRDESKISHACAREDVRAYPDVFSRMGSKTSCNRVTA